MYLVLPGENHRRVLQIYQHPLAIFCMPRFDEIIVIVLVVIFSQLSSFLDFEIVPFRKITLYFIPLINLKAGEKRLSILLVVPQLNFSVAFYSGATKAEFKEHCICTRISLLQFPQQFSRLLEIPGSNDPGKGRIKPFNNISAILF